LTILPFTQRADPPRIWIAYAANNRDTNFIDRGGIGLALFFGYRSYPPMTGGWAVVGVAAVGLIGHSVGCLVSLS
jgi:hypothetical protein